MNNQLVNKIILIGGILYAVAFLERFLSTYTNAVDKIDYTRNKEQFEIKINNYEKAIFEDSVIIYNSDRAYRDSLRATLNPR